MKDGAALHTAKAVKERRSAGAVWASGRDAILGRREFRPGRLRCAPFFAATTPMVAGETRAQAGAANAKRARRFRDI